MAALAPVIPVIIVVTNTLDKLNKARKLLQAARAADALAQEIQQQEEEGDAEAPQPPSPINSPEGGEPPEKDPDDDLFKRPEGVPEDWEREPSKKGGGVKYVDPKNKHNDVRIQKGKPESSNPGQQVDNVRWKKDGNYLDKNGNKVPRKSAESHIPLDEFIFDKDVFK